MIKRRPFSALMLAAIMSFGFTALPAELSPCVSVSAAAQLSAPKGMTTTENSGTVSIKWDAVKGADAYRVYIYDASKKKWKKYKTVTGTVCSLSGLKKGESYYFIISSLDKNGKSYTEGKRTAKFKVKIPASVAKKDLPKLPAITDYGFEDRTAKFSGKYTAAGRNTTQADYENIQKVKDWEQERNQQFKSYLDAMVADGFALKSGGEKVNETDMSTQTYIDLKIYYNGRQVGTLRRSYTLTAVKGASYKGGMKITGVDEIYIIMK